MMDTSDDNIELVINDKSIVLSKKMLCKESSYFEAMLRSSNKFVEADKKTVVINDLHDHEILIKVINFEEKQFHMPLKKILSMLEVANYFLFNEVRDKIIQFLLNFSTKFTCLRVYETASSLGVLALTGAVLPYCLQSFSSIEKVFQQEISFATLLFFLKHPKLIVENEMHVFQFLIRICEQWEDVKTISKNQITSIDFSRLSHADVTYIEKHELVEENVKEDLKNIIDCPGSSHYEDYYRYSADNIPHSENALCSKSFRSERYLPGGVARVKKETVDRHGNIAVVDCPVMFAFDTSTKQLNFFEYAVAVFPESSAPLNGPFVLYHEGLIYWIGGEYNWGQASWVDDIKTYDPITKKWGVLTKLNKHRRHHCCVWADDKLFVFGGTSNLRCKLDSAEYFDPSEDDWFKISKVPRYINCGICCTDQKNIYLFHDGPMMVYNIKRNQWKEVPLDRAFERISSATYDNGRIWITIVYTKKVFCIVDLDTGDYVYTGDFKYNPVDVVVHEDVMYNFSINVDFENVVEALSMAKMKKILTRPNEYPVEKVQSDIVMSCQDPYVTFRKNKNEVNYSFGNFCVMNLRLD